MLEYLSRSLSALTLGPAMTLDLDLGLRPFLRLFSSVWELPWARAIFFRLGATFGAIASYVIPTVGR